VPPIHTVSGANQCLLQEDFEQGRRSSVRARAEITVPEFRVDADGTLKAFGMGANEVLEGTVHVQAYNTNSNKNTSYQLAITPNAIVTMSPLIDDKAPRGTHPYTIQGTCTGHAITGLMQKLTQVTILLSH